MLGLRTGDVLASPADAPQQTLATLVGAADLGLRLEASDDCVTSWASTGTIADIGLVRLVDTRPSRCSAASVLVKDATDIVDFKATLVVSSTLTILGGAWPMEPGKPALIGRATRSGPRASSTELSLRQTGIPGGTVTSLAFDGRETVYAAVVTATTRPASGRVLESIGLGTYGERFDRRR